MSEYQYYEFLAIDRALDDQQLEEVRALSTRAHVTPTSFTNTYHYGSFRGQPLEMMKLYYDAFVYVANWGTRWLMFRFPKQLMDVEQLRPFCTEEGVALEITDCHVILELRSEAEPEGWEEGEGWLSALVPLRADLLSGDLRSLYLGWLCAAGEHGLDEERREPPVPAGLGNLSAPLKSFTNFLRIDPDLVCAAAQESAEITAGPPNQGELQAWIGALPQAEKDRLLVRLALEGTPLLHLELLRRFRHAQQAPEDRRAGQLQHGPRKIGELLAARDAARQERCRREAQRKAQEQRLRQAEL